MRMLFLWFHHGSSYCKITFIIFAFHSHEHLLLASGSRQQNLKHTDTWQRNHPGSKELLLWLLDGWCWFHWQLESTDPAVAQLQTGCVITYGSCPLTWGSRLQREVALSSTKAECIAISESSMRDALYLMQLVKDLRDCTSIIKIGETPPRVHCQIFKDNSGALEMVLLPKMRPRTRHMCVKADPSF